MSKTYSETDFSSLLDQDRTWRIREISDLKQTIRSAKSSAQAVLLRALVTLCYAHWEGHIKFVAVRYLQFVSLRRYSFSELNRQFVRNKFLPSMRNVSKKSYKECFDIIDEILDAGPDRFSRFRDDMVSTGSNLNSEILADICSICGVDNSQFSSKTDFIDVILLNSCGWDD